jgi:hypothetical protein
MNKSGSKSKSKTNCNNVISLKQYGGTCWFNSILMAVLYSDESRKLLLEKAKKWNTKIAVYKTLKYILINKYLRSNSIHNDYAYFDKIRPEYILKQLYRYNSKKFNFNPKKNVGYFKSLYIRKVYKLLGAKVLYVDKIGDDIYYSLYNNVKTEYREKLLYFAPKYVSYEKVKEKLNNPDVIIVNISTKFVINRYPEYYKLSGIASNFHIHNLKKIDNLKKLEDVIVFDNEEYVQDSILLNNWNNDDPNIGLHAITGITCNGGRYVYNGWTRSTIDPNIMKELYKVSPSKNGNAAAVLPDISIPCELMKYDWNINKDNSFCLNPKKCILDVMNVRDLCFSFNKGDRLVVYVKKSKTNTLYIDDKPSQKAAKPSGVKICPEGKVLNPLTNRCVNLKTLNKLPKKQLSIPEHPESPSIKIKKNSVKNNTNTNKDVNNIKNVKDVIQKKKICPEGSVLNPLTNRCNKIKKIANTNKDVNNIKNVKDVIQKKKICPEGSVLNPLTNRCNKIKKAAKAAKDPLKNAHKHFINNCPEGKVLNPLTKTCFDYRLHSNVKNV